MCRSDYLDRNERKYKPSEVEERQNQTANNCNKALKGQLSYTTEQWLRVKRISLS